MGLSGCLSRRLAELRSRIRRQTLGYWWMTVSRPDDEKEKLSPLLPDEAGLVTLRVKGTLHFRPGRYPSCWEPGLHWIDAPCWEGIVKT